MPAMDVPAMKDTKRSRRPLRLLPRARPAYRAPIHNSYDIQLSILRQIKHYNPAYANRSTRRTSGARGRPSTHSISSRIRSHIGEMDADRSRPRAASGPLDDRVHHLRAMAAGLSGISTARRSDAG